MPLIISTAPDSAKRALAGGVADFLDLRDPLANELKQGNLGLHVFSVGLEDIVEGQEIRGAKSVGWRFLTGARLGPAVACDVTERQEGSPKVTGVSRDPLISAAIRATHEIETLPAVREKDYELRVLRIPGLLIEAFWLVSRTGETDLLVPVLTRSRLLKVMQPYPVAEFLNIVRPLIAKFRQFGESQY
jgi:hypothetical protein